MGALKVAEMPAVLSSIWRAEDGSLGLQPYHEAYAPQLEKAAALLREAAELAEDPEFANYLRMRADALIPCASTFPSQW